MPSKLSAYLRLMRLDKPIGILLLLWPGLWALMLAGNGHPDLWVVTAIVLGTLVMRSAGCVINDYADRDFDPHVERTRGRPIASGEIQAREALWLFVGLCLLALLIVLTLNPLTIALSVPGAFLAGSYPFTKRYTHLPQAYLGIAFGWAVPMSFAAETQSLPATAWMLFVATAIWALIYDTQYAMVDREDDLRIGVKSTAILFGKYDRWILGGLQMAMIGMLWVTGRKVGLGGPFEAGLWVALGLFAYQQWLTWKRDRTACFKAFLNNNAVGCVIFLGILFDYGLRS